MKYFEYLAFRFTKGVISIVPWNVLYFLSNGFTFLIYSIFSYRKKVVLTNLQNSFPENSYQKNKRIADVFYQHFCDTCLESVKGYSADINSLKQRYVCVNPEITYPYFESGRDVIIALSHFGNWEWGTQVGQSYFKHQVETFYKPLSNKYLDNYIGKLRTRFGMKLISIYDQPQLAANQPRTPRMYFMVSDQSPNKVKKAIWVEFLNQETGCMRGIETLSKLHNMPVFYAHIRKDKRGFYSVTLEEICDNPRQVGSDEITRRYMQKLEQNIREQPEYWLWTHRRWKRKKSDISK